MNGGAGVSLALLDALRREELDTVAGAFAYRGGEDLNKAGLGHRRRTRLRVTDADGVTHELYLKRYGPKPLRRRLRTWLAGGGFRSEARAEFENIRAIRALGVPTMEAVTFGEDAALTGAGRSYIIVTAVPGEALERCGEEFVHRCAGMPGALEAFTQRLAGLVRTMHQGGYVHRDLYASHVFLCEREEEVDLYLIDLARAFQPRCRRFRWRIKDLAQLKYSMPSRWVERQWEVFLRTYLRASGNAEFNRWSAAIDRKVNSIRRRAERKARVGKGVC